MEEFPMRITKFFTAIFVISVSLLITSCSSLNSTIESNIPHTDMSSFDSEVDKQQLPSEVPEEVIDYALIQSCFFREPINDINSLYEHPNYFSFLITRVYSLYENNVLTIKDVSQNDWYKQYLIPVEYMEKASSLYLGIVNKLPEKFLNMPDYNYQKNENAFLFSPYTPPMFVTECTNATMNSDGTINVTIRISLIEEKSALYENTYVYQIVNDETWGIIYQLTSIK